VRVGVQYSLKKSGPIEQRGRTLERDHQETTASPGMELNQKTKGFLTKHARTKNSNKKYASKVREEVNLRDSGGEAGGEGPSSLKSTSEICKWG